MREMKYMVPNKRKRLLACSMTLLMLIGLSGCTTLAENESTAEYMQSGKVTDSGYKTTQVYEGSFDIPYEADASVVYTKSEYLYWESSQDRYLELLVSAGDMVKKGDVLATFEVSSIGESDILERTNAVQEAQTSLNRTIESYNTMIDAKKESMESLEGFDYQIAELELKKLESEYEQRVTEGQHYVAQAQEALNDLQEQKNQNELVAPFDGRISWVGRDFQKGNKVKVGSAIVQIEDLNSQLLQFKNSNYKGTVPYLSTVSLTDRVSGEEYTGTVVSCGNVTGFAQDEVLVELDTELPEGKDSVYFKATGYIARLTKVILVDSNAVKTSGTESYVHVLTDNNATYNAYVTTGDTVGGLTWIIDGVSPGQNLIVE